MSSSCKGIVNSINFITLWAGRNKRLVKVKLTVRKNVARKVEIIWPLNVTLFLSCSPAFFAYIPKSSVIFSSSTKTPELP